MASLIHIAEVASILAVAYMLGWVIGYVAHRLAAPRPAVATVPAERLAAVTGGDALVKAPVIAPLAVPPTSSEPVPEAATPAIEPVAMSSGPAASAEPAPSSATPENDSAVPSDAIAPAAEAALDAVPASEPEAGPTQPAAASEEPAADSPSISAEPESLTPAEAPPAPEPQPEAASVPEAPPAPEPQPEAASVPEAPAPELQPEAATAPASARPSIRSFRRFRSAIARSAAEPVQSTPPPATPAPPPAPFSATPASRPGEAFAGEIRGREAAHLTGVKDELASLAAAASAAIAPGATSEPTPVETPQAEAPVAEPPVADPAPPPAAAAAPVAPDEDAAMRAIEGGWSRVHTRALDGAPELSDLGAAVVAAQAAVEQVLAKAGIDADAAGQGTRPRGLSRPRNGVKDDLRRIAGIGALDESTLNNLGVYHFDQIANWNDAQILWMESHVFARGRIGHEEWQRQARELVASPAT